MVAANNAISNTVGASISGVTNTLTVTNPSNTASSAARETIVVGGGTAGDPTINWNVSGVTNWEMGIDNSATDSLKISGGTALGTNDTWIMDTSGRRTMPLQPCFSAYNAANILNVTGNGTTYTFGTGGVLTLLINQSTSMTTAGVFTAPVTGNYLFCGSLIFYESGGPIAAAFNQGVVQIVTTLNTFQVNQFNPAACQNQGGGSGFGFSVILPMTAGNNAILQCIVNGGAATIDVRAGSIFSGFLLC